MIFGGLYTDTHIDSNQWAGQVKHYNRRDIRGNSIIFNIIEILNV